MELVNDAAVTLCSSCLQVLLSVLALGSYYFLCSSELLIADTKKKGINTGDHKYVW